MTYIPEKLKQVKEIYYPDTDGKPMADNTLQFDYIVIIKINLEILYKTEKVFIAGDLFWYPIEGKPKIVVAPDVLVAFERPKGYRSSYKQWEEENIAPEVVFEVLSYSNTALEMLRKLKFYNTHGVKEFIIIDPYNNNFTVYEKENGTLEEVKLVDSSWKSSTMEVTIEKGEKEVLFYFPDGKPFRSPEEWNAMFEVEAAAKTKAVEEKNQAVEEKNQAIEEKEQERLIKEKALEEVAKLKAELEKLKAQ